ncbi:helix-turn-helix domain-containing protein [Andreprevotia chitinilytica]|uniref:helix-turn-helix domain-containing protein n=1 Tax=Andreprevotia chitinilytica TaxID=396808 RepID=UPI000A06AF86|nr:helix-turn-helix transcriptional regulator [Andreprevotia chitinilytica]
MTIGERLKVFREAKQLRQQDASSLFGVKPSSYQKYEMNISAPGAEAIERFVRAGINANWLLTGEGPMLLAELQAETPTAPVETARLQLALEAVEEGLAATSRTMRPDKKAELILVIYDLLDDVDATSKGKILRLVKLAA